VEKFYWAGQATDENMAHAHCMLDTLDYKYTQLGCVIHIAFLLQQWFDARALMLRYMYTASLVKQIYCEFLVLLNRDIFDLISYNFTGRR